MKLSDLKTSFVAALSSDYEFEELMSLFYQLIETFLGEHRFVLHLQPEYEVDESTAEKFKRALEDLKSHIPIQYIVGTTEFLGLELKVNSSVLIPRPETEDLILYLDSFIKSKKICNVLDIGTGSACIGLSLKKRLEEAEVHLMDVSSQALEVAKQNALLNNLKVEFIQADVLELKSLERTYDLIVSNPPYVRNLEKSEMNLNVLDHEPHLALFVPDEDPLLFYRKIAMLSKDHLNSGGMLCFEINEAFGAATVDLLNELGYLEVQLINDRFGKHRIVSAIG